MRQLRSPRRLFDRMHLPMTSSLPHGVNRGREGPNRSGVVESGVSDHRSDRGPVIDVNTGKFIGKTSLADTILRTNLACREICRQPLYMAGIIVIDFIDGLGRRPAKVLEFGRRTPARPTRTWSG